MMPEFLKGLTLGFAIAAPVGPIGVLCIRRTLTAGFAGGLAAGMGAASADAVYGMVAALGLTSLGEALIAQTVWLRLVGGLVLCWLGWRILRSPAASLDASQAGPSHDRAWGTTFLLTLSNPMTILFFAAAVAGLGTIEAGRAGAVVLVAGVFLGSSLWWLILAGVVSGLRRRLPVGALAWINRASGLMIIGFGVWSLMGSLPP